MTLSKLNPCLFLFVSFFTVQLGVSAQVETPQLSPVSTINQKVGLSDIEITYARPSKRNREVFGNVVAYDAMWRLGANKNTTITCSDDLYFGSDTLKKEHMLFLPLLTSNLGMYISTLIIRIGELLMNGMIPKLHLRFSPRFCLLQIQ